MRFWHEVSGPWLHVVTLSASAVADRVLACATHEPATAVRIVRASKMATEQQLFDECAAAYQFPYYFGENWDAFRDCISDLSWLPAQRYLTVVSGADGLLSNPPEHFVTLCEVLSDAGRAWAVSSPSMRPWAPEARPFHVVLQTTSDEPAVAAMLAAVGVPYDRHAWS